MKIKWFEDLIAVAEIGHFARAAEERFLTQSALSRRIKSLEIWIGAELLDRSSHPISLTAAGLEFIPIAREILAKAYEARGRAAELGKLSENTVAIACLHNLALNFVPRPIFDLQRRIGPFEISILSETRTMEEHLGRLQNGVTDIFVTFSHPSAQLELEEGEFAKISLGQERILPFCSCDIVEMDLSEEGASDIPYLEYSGTTFMSQVVDHLLHEAKFRNRLRTVFRASLAESLCTGAQQGLGVAWLPESIAECTQNHAPLTRIGGALETEFEVVAIRATNNARTVTQEIWNELSLATGPQNPAIRG